MKKLTTVKLRWAKKLLNAKYFVVMTDTESVIALDGVSPESFTDIMALTSQRAEVKDFHEKLGTLVKRHDKAVAKLMEVETTNVTTERKTTPKKIKVKQG